MWEQIKKAGLYLIWAGLALLLLLILVGSLRFLNPDATWLRTYTKHMAVVFVCGSILLMAALYQIYQWLQRVQLKYIRWTSIVLLGIFLLIEVIMLHEFYVIPITDAYKSLDAALSLLAGNITKIDDFGSYFSYYGNNYYVVLLFKKLSQIMYGWGLSDIYMFLFVFNALCIWVSVFLAWLSARLLLGERKSCFVLVLIVINPVFFGCIFWIYTLTFSMPIMMGILYLSIKLFLDDRRFVILAASGGIGILTVAGYYLRPTAVFPFIALIIVGVCSIRKCVHMKKAGIMTVAFLLCAGLSFGYVKSKIDFYTADTTRNLPVTHWIMMGLEGDGQFNGLDEKFSMSFPDKESAEENNIRVIKERINNMGFIGLVKHSVRKLWVTWGDGSHGFMDRLKQDTKFSKMYTFLAEGKTDAIILYCQIYHIVLLVLALMACILNIRLRNWSMGMQIVGITVFGGIIFYLLWESKNVYSIPFLMFAAIMASEGMPVLVQDKIKDIKWRERIIKGSLLMVIILTGMAAVLQYRNFTSVLRTNRQYTVNMYSNPSCEKIIDVSKNNRYIQQTFYATSAFNKIYIRANQVNNSSDEKKYRVELKDLNGTVLASREVGGPDIETRNGKKATDGYICLNFATIQPKVKKEYVICISSLYAENEDSLTWWYRKAEMLDNYKGIFSIDHQENRGDLFIVVSMETEATYTSPFIYVLTIVILILLEIGMLILYMKPYSSDCVKRGGII